MILHTKRQRSFFFSSSIVFGWTGWTGWTGTEKSGTSCVQPKILTLDRLDRRDDPPQREPRSYARWLVFTATLIRVVVTAAVTNAGLALDDPLPQIENTKRQYSRSAPTFSSAPATQRMQRCANCYFSGAVNIGTDLNGFTLGGTVLF